MNIDQLILSAVFSQDEKEKKSSRDQIRKIAKEKNIILSSIHNLYMASGRNEVKGFTIPAFNIRAMTYDTARCLFRLIKKHKVGAVIFEIARSEIDYTHQRPDEYAVVVLAAAIKEEYEGPVFLQGDHFQLSKNKFNLDQDAEIERIKSLTKESIDAGFYNIDIDASTLVDLSQPDLSIQQKNNFGVTAKLTEYIRSLQPEGTTISVGGEIGHIGGKNSSVSDFEAFMNGYNNLIKKDGISKVSVQTGSSHGGVPLPDGTIADVKIDFNVLKDIGEIARSKYKIGGPVQHGASTLPQELFGKFAEVGTLEIHLATGLQNIVYEHMPNNLKEEIYRWLLTDRKEEWEDGWSEEQFIYKTRKKALGPFKKNLWSLPDSEKQPIIDMLEKQFVFLIEKLNAANTKDIVIKHL